MARLTLTFDNGPHPDVTPRVLDVLAERRLRATFFVVARDLERPGARELVGRAREAGHWIGNHSATHTVPLGDGDDPVDQARREISEAQDVLGDLVHADRLFRPFGGGGVLDEHLLSAAAVDRLVAGGYSLALWNCVPRDWEDPAGWPETALTAMADQDWTVLVLHDLPTGAMDRLDAFLDAVDRCGLEVVQELPESCVPIRRGQVVGSLAGLVASDPIPPR